MNARALLCGAGALALVISAASADILIPPSGSITTSCPASGPATGAVSLIGGLPLARAAVTGTTDTMLTADCGGLVEYNNASGVAVTGLAASAAGSGFATVLVNLGAGAVTVTSAGGNFSSTGTTSLVVASGSSATIQSDGSAWNVTVPEAIFIPPGAGAIKQTLQNRGYNEVFVTDYGASGSGNRYNTTGTVPPAATSITLSNSSHDFTVGEGMLIPLAGDAFSASAVTVAATLVHGPSVRANGVISTGAATITMQGPPISGLSAGVTHVFDLSTGQDLGTYSSWTGHTLTLSANAAFNGLSYADVLGFQSGDAHGQTWNANGAIATNQTSITMATGGNPLNNFSDMMASFTGSISGSTLTTSSGSGTIQPGATLYGAAATRTILAYGTSGTTGTGGIATCGAGTDPCTYKLSSSTTGSGAMTTAPVITVYDVTQSAAIGPLTNWSGTTLTIGGSGSLINGFGSSDALAFIADQSWSVSPLDPDHTDGAGGHSGGGIGAAVSTGTQTGLPYVLGSQDIESIRVTGGVFATVNASASFAAQTGKLSMACPTFNVRNMMVTDTTLSPNRVLGWAASCSNGTLYLTNDIIFASSGASDALAFSAGYSVWRTLGGVIFWVNGSIVPAFPDSGNCNGGACSPSETSLPFNIPSTPPVSALNDWAAQRKVTSVSGAVVGISPATVTSTGVTLVSPESVHHDDADSFARAIAALSTGGIVHVPCPSNNTLSYATYRISFAATVTVPNIRLLADGRCVAIAAMGVTDLFDFLGAVGSAIPGGEVSNFGTGSTTDQSIGWAIFADHIDQLVLKDNGFDKTNSCIWVQEFNGGEWTNNRCTNLTSDPEQGIRVQGTVSTGFGQIHINHSYIGGNANGNNWPELDMLGYGFQVDGPIATVVGYNNQIESPSGPGLRVSNDWNGTAVPFGVDLEHTTAEFGSTHQVEFMVGKYNQLSNSHIRAGGFTNWINCGQSSSVFLGDTDTNASTRYVAGDIDSSSGANVYFDGIQASVLGPSIFDGSNTNAGGKPFLLGPPSANGNCPGAEFSGSATNNILAGSVIGNSAHAAWQAEPALLDSGATNNIITPNTFAGNVLSQVVDNSGNTTNIIGPNAGSTGAFVWANQMQFPITTLTDASTIAWATNQAQVAKVTLAASRTMGAPSNLVAGGTYDLYVIQGGSGTNAITWNSVFKWPSGTAPALSTSVGAVDLISCISLDGTNLDCVAQTGFQ